MHLACHVGAAVGGVARQPFGGVRVGLLLVRRAVCSEQVFRVVRQLAALLCGQILRAGLPCVRKGHHVVNLHGRGGLLAALELDGLAGVRVIQRAANYGACVGPDLETKIGQVAAQNVVASVALVTVNVIPGGAELFTRVASLRRAFLHLQGCQLALRGRQIRCERGRGVNCLVRVLDLSEGFRGNGGFFLVGGGGRRIRTEQAVHTVLAHIDQANNQHDHGKHSEQTVNKALLLRVHRVGQLGQVAL